MKKKNLSHGLYFLSSLTYGKAMNDLGEITNGVSVDNSYNLRLAKQPSSFYRKANWVTSFDYLLPFGKGTSLLSNNKALDLIVGGWHFTGIFTMTAGTPLTPQMSYDSSKTGTQGATLPNRIGNGELSGSQRSLYQWFNVAAFVDDPTYSFGNSVNAPNHPNWGNPSTNIDGGPGSAGAITSTQGSNRVTQLGLKYQS